MELWITSLQKEKERRSDSAQRYKAWRGSCREQSKRSHDETAPNTSSRTVRKAHKIGAGSKQYRAMSVEEKPSGSKFTAASRIKRLEARDDIAKRCEVPYFDRKQLDLHARLRQHT
jgi:hypothetical protein